MTPDGIVSEIENSILKPSSYFPIVHRNSDMKLSKEEHL